MTRNELIWKIEHGDDIMFDVIGKHYTILTWLDEGILIAEQYKEPGEAHEERIYQTAEELVDGFMVNETPLKELCDKVVITSYTLVQ